MGGVILFAILVLLVAILIAPAVRARVNRLGPTDPPAADTPPHEVVVHRLDDHRADRRSGDAPDRGDGA